ncbi:MULTISPECIES: CaiB/BaiF CoA-transferase family protein [unclassified Pseudonocardia]|uniref:CaiB/BaiF CoA transferase family protein n=1 Tax=unclassified Pseudonocardia TaxID=2619320 RepID=UPI00143A656C|nr:MULTISPECIES: CaiB/BaiF CoA-transferase family protein [unclassified Pseudonocardia]
MRPLDDVTVVDFSRYAPGLFGTRVLADLGARVVSVEPPGLGEESPLYRAASARANGDHPFWRGRRSAVLDLRSDAGRAAAQTLIAGADVVVEGFRPGVADRLGIGFDTARSLRPNIVYCAVTGYGQQGPDAKRPGHDLNYLSEAGVLSLTSSGQDQPGIPLNLVADLAGGGLTTAVAILGALHSARRGSEAQYLDVAMVRSVLALLAPVEAMTRAGTPDPSWRAGMLNGAAPYYRCYRTRDGGWVAVGAIEPKFYSALCIGTGLPEFADKQADQDEWPMLEAALTQVFATRDRDEWCTALADAAVTPVLDVPAAWERAAPWTQAGPAAMTLVPGLIEPRPKDGYAHRAGADTAEVLREFGCTPAAISAVTSE